MKTAQKERALLLFKYLLLLYSASFMLSSTTCNLMENDNPTIESKSTLIFYCELFQENHSQPKISENDVINVTYEYRCKNEFNNKESSNNKSSDTEIIFNINLINDIAKESKNHQEQIQSTQPNNYGLFTDSQRNLLFEVECYEMKKQISEFIRKNQSLQECSFKNLGGNFMLQFNINFEEKFNNKLFQQNTKYIANLTNMIEQDNSITIFPELLKNYNILTIEIIPYFQKEEFDESSINESSRINIQIFLHHINKQQTGELKLIKGLQSNNEQMQPFESVLQNNTAKIIDYKILNHSQSKLKELKRNELTNFQEYQGDFDRERGRYLQVTYTFCPFEIDLSWPHTHCSPQCGSNICSSCTLNSEQQTFIGYGGSGYFCLISAYGLWPHLGLKTFSCTYGGSSYSVQYKLIYTGNLAPVFSTSLTNMIIKIGYTKTYSLPSINDTQVVDITFSSTLPSFITFSQVNKQFTVSPGTTVVPQDYLITIDLSDGNLTTSYSWKVTVQSNSIPAFVTQPTTTYSLRPSKSWTYSLPAFVNDGDTITVNGPFGIPTWGNFDSSLYRFSFNIPSTQTAGTSFSITYKLYDGVYYSSMFTLTITIIANQLPVFSTTPPSSINFYVGATYTNDLSKITDGENDPVTATMTLTPSTTLIKLNYLSLLQIYQIQCTTTLSQTNATYDAKISLYDTLDYNPYTIKINIINRPPSLLTLISDQIVHPGISSSYSITIQDPDDSTGSKLSIVNVNPTMPTANGISLTSSPYAFKFNIPLATANTTIPVSFKISDSVNTVGPFSFSVIIENRAPVWTPHPFPNVDIKVGQSVPFNPTPNDPEGAFCKIAWNQQSPGDISFVTLVSGYFSISPPFTQIAGVYTIDGITASDGISTTTQESFDINVINDDPIVPLTVDQQVTVNTVVTYQLKDINDPENGPLTFDVPVLPAYVTFDIVTRIFTFQPEYTIQADIIQIRSIKVSDGVNDVYTQEFQLEVINLPPVYQGIASTTLNAGETKNVQIPSTTDPEGNSVTITVNGLESWTTVDISYNLKISPPFDQTPGSFDISVLYNDGVQDTESLIKINVVNAPPYFEYDLENQLVTGGDIAIYTLPKYIDPENGPVQVIFKYGLPNFVAFDNNIGVFTFLPVVDMKNGEVLINITLSDGHYQVDYNFTIIINEFVPKEAVKELAASLSNSGPPFFANAFSEIQIYAGVASEFYLPSISDPDNDDVLPPEIKLNSAMPFTKIKDSMTLTFYPSEQQAGTYKFNIILQDQNAVMPRSQNYEITLKVLSKEAPRVSVPIVSKEEQVLSQQSDPEIETILKRIALKPSVNQAEQLIIKFSPSCSDMKVPMQLNNSTMELFAVPRYILSKTTKIEDMNLKIIQQKGIKINFEVFKVSKTSATFSLDLSQLQNQTQALEEEPFDTLYLRVNETLISSPENDTGQNRTSLKLSHNQKGKEQIFIDYIKSGEANKAYIPLQLSPQLLATAGKVKGTIALGSYAFMPANAFLQIVTAGAISYLWAILEGLTQITVLSLISIQIPGIANLVNANLLNFAQMDILPSSSIEESFLEFDDSNEQPLNDNFQAFGFSQTNCLRNMGSTFIFLMFGALLLCVILALQLFSSTGQVQSQCKKFYFIFLPRLLNETYIFGIFDVYQLVEKCQNA